MDTIKRIADNPVVIALATAAAMWVGGWVRQFLARRVRVQSPEAMALGKVVPAVNALLAVQGPQMEGIIAILEAQQGQCNGNVAAALKANREAKTRFDTFIGEQAQVHL